MNFTLPPGGSVIGLGSDLVECSRIARIFERQQEQFLDRVFTEGERDYCLKMRNPVPHLAARFAAKEAVAKAFTTGIGAELGWKSIEVIKGPRDQPLVRLDEQGQNLLHALGGTDILITLTHTANHAQAVALIVKAT